MDYYEFIRNYGKKRVPDVHMLLRRIRETYLRVTAAPEARAHRTPAEEWIADNYYLLEETVRNAEETHTGGRGRARTDAYRAALFIVLNTDGRAGEDAIVRYADQYEENETLTVPALRAFPDMLRLALVERVACLCAQTEELARQRAQAAALYERFAACVEGDAHADTTRELDILFTSVGTMTPAFVESLLRTASAVNTDTTRLHEALARRLAGGGLSAGRMIEGAHRTQIALGAEIGNCIRSLAELKSLAVDAILSRLNRVEQILCEDPAGVFPHMARDTKDAYIRCVYRSAGRKRISPALEALTCLEEARRDACHVGLKIEGLAGPGTARGTARGAAPDKRYRRRPLGLTLAGMVLAVLTPVLGPLLFLLCVLCAEGYRCLASRLRRARVLPSMDFAGRIPENISVMLVMPALLSDPDRARDLVRQLAALLPAGRMQNLYCALIGDLPEAAQEHEPGDAAIIGAAQAERDRCNRQCPGSFPHFTVFVRPRTYCQTEGCFAGRERKRGALLDFSDYLAAETAAGRLPQIRYVITLDADSVLTYSGMVRLVEMMEHPLNRPQIDDRGTLPVVRSGYAVIAPAARTYSPGASAPTPFARLLGGESGFGGYSGRTAEYYFDHTGCGIYAGKGIFDPEMYRHLLHAPFASETLLSHDLIEGAFLRAGFASDVHLYETFPQNAGAYLKRMHRWVRGDWQLLPYMRRSFRGQNGALHRSPLREPYPSIMRANLCQSAAPVLALLALFEGLCLPLPWGAPLLLLALLYVFREAVMNPCRESLQRGLLECVLLPQKGILCADAIVRTLYRLFFSGRHLLSWVTARDSERHGRGGIAASYRENIGAVLLGLVLCGLSPWRPLPAAVCALTLGVLWLASPCVLWRLGRTPEREAVSVSRRERRELLLLARKIWAYYEDYATPGDHDLPPDNVQFRPVYSVAHRTSPTNIGFLILSSAASCRLGFLTPGALSARLGRILDTLDCMEKHCGHLFNWYDTITLEPLQPRFVSSVDSGNLAACMMAACGILRRMTEEAATVREDGADFREAYRRAFDGVQALCDCMRETAEEDGRIGRRVLEPFAALLEEENGDADAVRAGWRMLLEACRAQAQPRSEHTEAALYRHKLLTFCEETADPHALFVCRTAELEALCDRMTAFCGAMDFRCLFDAEKGLFSTGLFVQTGRLADSHYDIYASEARLTSAVAAAKGDVPESHFTRMSRKRGDGTGILQSWSGTAFEYLLPDLFLPSPPDSLWDVTVRLMLQLQQAYGREKEVPWGVSESCYNAMDITMHYKYRAFGVPSLSVRGQTDGSLVVAPYASMMAVHRAPQAVLANLRRLRSLGAWGRYGYYEAVDYTLHRGGIVFCYMAHHLGMGLASVADLLDRDAVRNGFLAGADMSALRIYAQEQKPKGYGRRRLLHAQMETGAGRQMKTAHGRSPDEAAAELEEEVRAFGGSGRTADGSAPAAAPGAPAAVNILSNGRYTVVTEDHGGGFSRCGDVLMTKYWSDAELSRGCGVHLYIGDGHTARIREGVFRPDRTVYRWSVERGAPEGRIEAEESVCVSAEDDTEIRLLRIPACSAAAAGSATAAGGAAEAAGGRLCITAFAEPVLNTEAAYRAHPAFSDLFLVSEALWDDDGSFLGLMLMRRREPHLYAFFGLFCDGAEEGVPEYDTDLAAVYGRNNDSGIPEAVTRQTPLTGTVGAVITPCFAVRRTPAADTHSVWLCMGLAAGRETCRERLRKYRTLSAAQGAFELARTRAMVEREHVGLRPGEFRMFSELFGSLIRRGSAHAAAPAPESLAALREQLRPFGVSGERPLVTILMRRLENSASLERMVRFWCALCFRAFPTDLVIVAFDDGSYMSPIRELADRVAQRALSGAFGVRGELLVVVPGQTEGVLPLLAASNLVFWL